MKVHRLVGLLTQPESGQHEKPFKSSARIVICNGIRELDILSVYESEDRRTVYIDIGEFVNEKT